MKTATSSTIYRLVGGAPIRVNSWAAVGGVHPVTTLDASTWNGLRTVPADGTFLRAGTGGIIFRIAGGAPIRVNSWTAVGGTQPYTVVDPLAITDAGHGGDWNHLRAYPADGTFLRAGTTGVDLPHRRRRRPIRVNSWAAVGGVHPYTVVDPLAITDAGHGGDWNHLRAYPADGTFLRAGTTGVDLPHRRRRRPLRVNSWAAVGGAHPYTVVDPLAITDAGHGGDWNHLRAYPADGTFLRAGTTGAIFRIAGGGAPIRVNSWAAVGGVQPYTVVDPLAITDAGHGGDWNHLRAYPADGTFLRAGTTGVIFRIAGGGAPSASTPGPPSAASIPTPSSTPSPSPTPDTAATGTTYAPTPPTAPSSAPAPPARSSASPAAHPCTSLIGHHWAASHPTPSSTPSPSPTPDTAATGTTYAPTPPTAPSWKGCPARTSTGCRPDTPHSSRLGSLTVARIPR